VSPTATGAPLHPKVYELLRTGDLPSVRIGTCRRIPADSLTTFLTSLRAG